MIELTLEKATILDTDTLETFADFNADYLLAERPRSSDVESVTKAMPRPTSNSKLGDMQDDSCLDYSSALPCPSHNPADVSEMDPFSNRSK